MAKFKIDAYKWDTKEKKIIYYDSSLSTLTWEDGTSIINVKKTEPKNIELSKIAEGKRNLSLIKIQMGLSCNFSCEYCSQRFVPHSDETNPDDVQNFVDNMSNWYKGDGTMHFEFWGGEPFVYWKTMKPLAEKLKEKYPQSTMSVITNGSLLDIEKNDWLEKLNFSVAISHDGPGQHVRGPNPLDDENSKNAILDLFKRLAPINKLSFSSMVNSKNQSREKIQNYFIDLIQTNLGVDYLKDLHIGEGGFVDAYDEGGFENSLKNIDEIVQYRTLAFNELRGGKTNFFEIYKLKISNFIKWLENGKKIEEITQKCGMDQENNIAVDLNGNVLTCQNVSAVSKNPAGISHHIGHVNDLNSVKIATATHWSNRNECPKCPVIHLCQGSCLFLTGNLWEISCDNAFSDNIIIFMYIIEMLSGYIPVYIEGDQREDRKDVLWWINGKPKEQNKAKKVIPINIIN